MKKNAIRLELEVRRQCPKGALNPKSEGRNLNTEFRSQYSTFSILPSVCYSALGLFLFTVVLFCSRGASHQPSATNYQPTDQRVVAQVNGERLFASELLPMIPPPDADSQAWQESKRKALMTLVDRALMLQLARKLHYQDSITAPLAQHTADLVVQMLRKYAQSTLTITPADVARESLLLYTNIHLKRIEVTNYDTAQMVGTLLKNGVPFESLADRFSRSRTMQPGGDMGFGPKAGVPPEVMNALKRLKPGEATGLLAVGVNFDFLKYEGERMVPAESVNKTHAQLQSSAQRRKAEEYLRSLHNSVQYDERALDRLTRNPDSLKPSDAATVVARLPDGTRSSVGSLLPIVKGYGDVLPSVRRQALRDYIENDALERELRRLKLDQTPVYEAQLKYVTDRVLYDFASQRQIVAQAQVSDSEVSAFFHQHPELYPDLQLTPETASWVRSRLVPPRQQERANVLLEGLRRSARITIDEELLAALKPDTTPK